jgi:hypothetical protein
MLQCKVTIKPIHYLTMVTITTLGETRVLLENISWQTFKTMVAETGSERKNRIAYDNNIVEIITPLMPHENSNRFIEGLVCVLCEELGLEIKRTGSLTLTRDDCNFNSMIQSFITLSKSVLEWRHTR